MQKELIVHVEESVYNKANEYAETNGKSLTGILEEYLLRLAKSADNQSISSVLQRLYGALHLPEGIDTRELLTDEFLKKQFGN